MASSRGTTSDASASTGWDHTRIQEGQTGASQKPWRKVSERSAAPGYVASDKAPLTSHNEWADQDVKKDLTRLARSDLELQTLRKTFYQ